MTKLKIANLVTVALTLSVVSACSLQPQKRSIDSVEAASASNLKRSGYNGYKDRRSIGRHFYAGVGAGASWLQPVTDEVPDVDVNDRVNAGGQITVGMDLSRQVALELHSADLGSAGLSPTGRINYHLHGASALFYAGKQRHNYRRQGLTGYGRLGVGMLDNSAVGDVDYEKENNAHVLFGAGLEYMTSIGLGMRAEAIAYEKDVRYGQLALVYRTGERRKRKPVEIAKAPSPVVVPAVKVIEPLPQPAIGAANQCDEFNGVLDGVNFHTDSANLTYEGEAVLDQTAQNLLSCDHIKIRVSAHTDSVGSEPYNQSLSERRARSVVNNLAQHGIEESRMTSSAYGETQPIDDNATADGRRRNRRVELITQ